MACLLCERLRRESDRLEMVHRLALNTERDNPGGDEKQRMLLRAMVQLAKTDMVFAKAELLQHQDRHGALKVLAAAGSRGTD